MDAQEVVDTLQSMDAQSGPGLLSIIIAIGGTLAMLSGIWLIFARLKDKDQGLGPNALKGVGIVLFVPSILLMAVHGRFASEALAALLGTVAGYVLSHPNDGE